MIITSLQKLTALRSYDEESEDEDAHLSSDSTSSSSSSAVSSAVSVSGEVNTKPGVKSQQQNNKIKISEGELVAFDRHLVEFGCQTFQEFFEMHPEIFNYFDQYSVFRLTEKLSVSEALKMHASRVLAVVGDIMNNSANPEKIRSILQELGKQHVKQVNGSFVILF